MDNFNDFHEVSEEFVAAWLDGNLSNEDDSAFADILTSEFQLAEILDAYDDIESDYETLIEEGYEIPEILGSGFTLPSINSNSFEDDLYGFPDFDTLDTSDDSIDSDEIVEIKNETESPDSYDELFDDMKPMDLGFL